MNSLLKNSFICFVVTAALLLAGCATTTPTTGNETDTIPPVQHYIIGPGDSLQIFVRDNPKLSTLVPVRPDGRISIPLVQSIMAAGKTPDQLADALSKKLSRYIRSPLVTVIVKSFVGAYSQQVRVVGQAATPMSIPYRRGMTLLDVMIKVGGLTKFASGNNAKIIRQMSDGTKKTFSVRLGDLMEGNVKDNIAMRPGDILIIPQALF